MSGTNSTKALLQGTAILALAAFLSKLMGVIYKIPYQNITGDAGFGIYETVYPVYMILLTLSTAGIPVALSKMVSERLVVGDKLGARKIFRVSAITLTITGVFFFLLLFFIGAPVLSWFNDEPQLVWVYRSVAFALLIVPVMASIRGYYQGHQDMMPTGVSQVVEQLIRVTAIIVSSYWIMRSTGDEYQAGAAAVFGATIGAVAAFVVLLLYWRRIERLSNSNQAGAEISVSLSYAELPVLTIMKHVLSLAIPISLAALVLPLFQLVDSLSLPRLLLLAGWPSELIMEQRGVFARGQALVQFGAFFATALALALVPSISEAKARRDDSQIKRRTHLALKLTFIVGLAAACGLALLARPVNMMLYMNDSGSLAIAILAIVIIFTTISITTSAILQGIGKVLLPAKNLFIGVLVKLLGNLLLVPFVDIEGAAISSVAGYAAAAFLNTRDVIRYTNIELKLSSFLLRPMAAVSIMVLAVWAFKDGLAPLASIHIEQGRWQATLVSLGGVVTGILIYALALLKSKAITYREVQMIPRFERFLPMLVKVRLINRDEQL